MYPIVQALAVLVAGRLNQRQQNIIEYLREEISVLREQLGGNDSEFRRPRSRGWR